MINIIFTFYIANSFVLTYLMVRNYAVYDRRMELLDYICTQDDWFEKRKLLDHPTYNQMVFSLKPVKSYYKEYLK